MNPNRSYHLDTFLHQDMATIEQIMAMQKEMRATMQTREEDAKSIIKGVVVPWMRSDVYL
jgi:hypothetical protein